jgi:hypothetical protein
MDRMIITLSIALVIVVSYCSYSDTTCKVVIRCTTFLKQKRNDDGTVIAKRGCTDSDSDSDDEDKKMIEEFSARDAMTITERPKQST